MRRVWGAHTSRNRGLWQLLVCQDTLRLAKDWFGATPKPTMQDACAPQTYQFSD